MCEDRTPTSDVVRPDIHYPVDNMDSCQMYLSKNAPCHPRQDSYHRHSTHHPHHKQSSRRNRSLILPSSHHSSRPTILNIYDKLYDCKGVPQRKTPKYCQNCRFGGFVNFCHTILLHLTGPGIIGSGHLCAQHLVQLHTSILIIGGYPENTYEIKCNGCQDLP